VAKPISTSLLLLLGPYKTLLCVKEGIAAKLAL
jgi:hypothetical protein